MQIMNSGATMAALGELKKNDTTLGKELKKVASGMKVNSAGDGASEYAISEKMRVRLRSLDQDIENVQTGKNLVRTAEGGIQEIVNNLRSMKTMAIDSANDHNTDTDRATIDKEFQQRIEEIDDIANTTNYNRRLRCGATTATTIYTRIGRKARQPSCPLARLPFPQTASIRCPSVSPVPSMCQADKTSNCDKKIPLHHCMMSISSAHREEMPTSGSMV